MLTAVITSWDFSYSICPKENFAIFVIVDVILVVAAIIAAFRHVKILYVILAFFVLSAINGLFLIVAVVRRPRI